MNSIVKGLLLLAGVGVAGYVVYQMYERAKSQDSLNSANAQKSVSYNVDPLIQPKQKPTKVLRVVGPTLLKG